MEVRVKAPKHEEMPDEPMGQRKRPDHNQFRLQVDRQTKSSYATFEAAETAAKAIKTRYPVVQVVVRDAVTNGTTEIEATPSE
jgi:hypothetical protein